MTSRRSGSATLVEIGKIMRRSAHSLAAHSSKEMGSDGNRGDDQNDDHAASSGAHCLPSSPHSQAFVSLPCTTFTWKCRWGPVDQPVEPATASFWPWRTG
ncbi:MAG TPA: hypothetical protein VGL13_04750 [Polyangiaceae bacterium]